MPNNPPNYPRNSDLADFSQSAINRGQQQINYLITDALKEIVSALGDVKYALSRCCSQVDLGPLEKAIREVSEATEKVASIFPPGCGGPFPE